MSIAVLGVLVIDAQVLPLSMEEGHEVQTSFLPGVRWFPSGPAHCNRGNQNW